MKLIEAKECGKLARHTVGISAPVAKVHTMNETKDTCRFCSCCLQEEVLPNMGEGMSVMQ